MDKQFQIRGYQKVDLELNQENSEKLRNGVKAFKTSVNQDGELFEKLTIDNEGVKFHPLNSTKSTKITDSKQKTNPISKKMTPKEIYEEFWEFIDDTNEIFHEFIIKDNRRQNISIDSNFNKEITV